MEQKLKDRVIVDAAGCWIWQLRIHNNGYGVFKVGNPQKTVWAHRISYETFVGPIPKGLTIDHLCMVKACINPHHLEPVTVQENNKRAYKQFLLNNPDYPCGHQRTGPTIITGGKRRCLPCWREYQNNYQRKYKERNRAAANRIH